MVAKASGFEASMQTRDELAKVIKRQLGVLYTLGLDESGPDRANPAELLAKVAGRVASQDLKVLIMGHFNAGKSTLINALLGFKILPAKMMPTTAFINEIRYAPDDQKRIVIHPKPGRWEGGDGPFPIDFAELDKYLTIDHSDGTSQAKSSPFAKVELFWPLPLCKNKVEIIDSPGLNDPDSHDKITIDYLPNADAIIYCMSCDAAFTDLDSKTIAMLRNLGYTSLIFVLTKFDRVRESAFLNGNDEEKEYVRAMVAKLKDLTELGRQGIFFVDSLHAMMAKMSGDPAALADTGIPDLERDLEEYLVRTRFRSKVNKAIIQVRTTNNDAQANIDDRIAMANTSLKELEDRARRAQEPLAQLKQKSDLILGKAEVGMTHLLRGVSDRARSFLISCPDHVKSWIDGYEPDAKLSWNPMNMRKSIENLADDYLGQIQLNFQLEISEWLSKELVPWIEVELDNLFKSFESMTLDYNTTLRQVRLALDFKTSSGGSIIAESQSPSMASKLGGLVYSFVTHDWINGSMVSIFGVKGLLRGLAAQLVGGAILGIVGGLISAPIGLPALIATAIISGGLGGVLNFMDIKTQIRKKVIASEESSLRDHNRQIELANKIEQQIDEKFKDILKSMRRATREDIDSVDASVRKALAEKRQGEEKVEQERRLLAEATKENRDVATAILDLAAEAKV
jgi:GTP-binding protein EngB required for normal cell division